MTSGRKSIWLLVAALALAVFCQVDMRYWFGPFASWQDCQEFAQHYMANGHTALCQYRF